MNHFKTAIARPYRYLLLIAIMSLIGSSYLRVEAELVGGATFLASISAATFGSYITVVLIDRSFRQQEAARRQQMQEAALRQLRRPLNSHLTLLGEMYIVTADQYPDSPPATYATFFDGDFVTQVQQLDFAAEYPTVRDNRYRTWFDHAAYGLQEFQTAIDQLINQYSAWLDPSVVETLQSVRDSELLILLISAFEVDIIGLDQEKGFDRTYTMLFGHDELIQTHLIHVLDLLKMYDDEEDITLTSVDDLSVWSENVTPHPNSAFLNTESDPQAQN